MGRNNKLSAEICIEVDGQLIPYLKIDKDGKVTWFVSDEDQQKYEQAMLKNIGENMSRYYSAHPEYMIKENNNEKRTA